MEATSQSTAAVLRALEDSALLLLQDKRLPSVVTLLTGESLKGSWWSHPKSHRIFAVLTDLSDHPDVLFTKLLHGKVTLVHRKLWPALVAVGSANAPWQLRGLSPAARRLLASLSTTPLRSRGTAVNEIEKRLLVHTVEVHTESGRHETLVEPWAAFSKRAGVRPLRSAARARNDIERAATAIGAPLSALPWASPARRRSR